MQDGGLFGKKLSALPIWVAQLNTSRSAKN